MDSFWTKNFGNPSAVYEEGRIAKAAMTQARSDAASVLKARPDEIIFTAGGTESDNLAILGIARKYKQRGNHIIVSKIEHHAVLDACEALHKEGFEITYLGIGKGGIVDLGQLRAALRPETLLVSVMYANNEIGTVQPIAEIAKIIRRYRKEQDREIPFFHTDAVQAPLYLDLNVQKLGVDLLTLNGSKIYGPKGIGCLYLKRGLKLEPLLYGGGQEMNYRSGTENIPAIVGFSRALQIAQQARERESERLTKLRDYFIGELEKKIPDIVLNGSREQRLPNNINVSVMGVEGEAAVLYLDEKGVAVSTGSACSSDSLDPSHVILALGVPHEYAHGSLRFTLGKRTKKADLDYVLKILPKIIEKLRSISALDKNYAKKG
jgi:cysteine desulfurase